MFRGSFDVNTRVRLSSCVGSCLRSGRADFWAASLARWPHGVPNSIQFTRSFASVFEQTIIDRSLGTIVGELALNTPTTALPQPDFSDFNKLRRRKRTGLSPELLEGVQSVDPFELVSDEISMLSNNIKELLGSDHPVLEKVAKYFFDGDAGKKVRPALVLLIAKATAIHHATIRGESIQLHENILKNEEDCRNIFASQRRLAEITEMIHTASLLHDDVIDVSDTRRGIGSVNKVFGNKVAILAGDFLLARASVCLARLRNVSVLEVLSTVIEDLVKGEIMQMKSDSDVSDPFQYYLRKNYYKTGSLVANSLMACTILAGHPVKTQQIAFNYGESIGHAFQLVDDALDFEGSLSILGKPALNDLKQGYATAPILLARDFFPEIGSMIDRKFSDPDDLAKAADCVREVSTVAQTRRMAMGYAEKAIKSIKNLTPSAERDALIHLARIIADRSK